MKLYEYLDLIRVRPGMYIGKHDIFLLRSDLGGFMYCAYTHNLDISEKPDFHHFHDYIAVILGYDSSTSGWANMLNDYYKDPKIALDKFFEHLDDFKRDMKGKTCLEMGEFLKFKGYELHCNFSEEYGCKK